MPARLLSVDAALKALVFVVLATGLVLNAPTVGAALLPLFAWLVPLIYGRFDGYRVDLVQQKTEWVYQLQTRNTHPIPFAEMRLPAHLDPSSHTLLAHSLFPVLLFGLVILAGSLYRHCIRWKLGLAALFLVAALQVLDVPFVLTGAIEDLLVYHFGDAGVASRLRVGWMNFLNNGGRLGLALGFAWLALQLAAVPGQRGGYGTGDG